MSGRRLRLLALAAALLAGAWHPLRAQQPVSADTGLVVTVVTFGIGEQFWERFGHNALWFHDGRTGVDVAYDWGRFGFDEPGFLGRFLTGDTRYWMAGQDARAMIEGYRRIGRTVTLQRLHLTPAQAAELRARVAANALEENKYYRYDYFRDNCSTRLRDAIDVTLGGALRRVADTLRTTRSYRGESVRVTDGAGALQLGIDLALGRPADAPLSEWESWFLPMRLRDGLRAITVPAGAGGVLPLVAAERQLDPPGGARVVERASVPNLVWRYLVVGVAFAALALGLRVMMLTRRSAAWGLALFNAGWWLLCGVTGVLIALAWAATRHDFWDRNEHLLLLTPLCLLLVVLAPMAILSGRAVRAARVVALAVAACGLAAALLALLPGGQASGAIVALLLPVHLALAAALVLPRTGRA